MALINYKDGDWQYSESVIACSPPLRAVVAFKGGDFASDMIVGWRVVMGRSDRQDRNFVSMGPVLVFSQDLDSVWCVVTPVPGTTEWIDADGHAIYDSFEHFKNAHSPQNDLGASDELARNRGTVAGSASGLAARLRPAVEAAPWVIAEVGKLEASIASLRTLLIEARERESRYVLPLYRDENYLARIDRALGDLA